MIEKMAEKQNWAKLTPWLGVATIILLFIYTSPTEVIFWALINIPLYLFHQTEEHYLPGGFKQYINTVINKLPEGEEILTDKKVFWINILLVWVAFSIFGVLSFVNIGFGLLIIFFSLMNCTTHIVTAIKQKEWNPGLVIASLQFIISIYGAYFISIYGDISDVFAWWIATILFFNYCAYWYL
jgi:hypothetical protein